jgi:nucleoside-diphosphate-sugar epimerase
MQERTVAVLGGTGVLARHLIPRLTAAGFRVRALVRRPEASTAAIASGAEVHLADIFDENALFHALVGCDLGINLATSLPGPSGRGDFDANDRLRREGTPVWIRACKRANVRRVIQQSIAMVNAAGGDLWSDEDTVGTATAGAAAARAIEAAIAMEQSVRSSGLEFLILRGGLFYGPGTGFDDDWFSRAQAGRLRLPGEGEDFVSLVHIADMAEATARAASFWPAQNTLVLCDDRPARWREVFSHIAQVVGADAPLTGGRAGFPSFRVRNRRAREALSWAPRYGDFRIGLAR